MEQNDEYVQYPLRLGQGQPPRGGPMSHPSHRPGSRPVFGSEPRRLVCDDCHQVECICLAPPCVAVSTGRCWYAFNDINGACSTVCSKAESWAQSDIQGSGG